MNPSPKLYLRRNQTLRQRFKDADHTVHHVHAEHLDSNGQFGNAAMGILVYNNRSATVFCNLI